MSDEWQKFLMWLAIAGLLASLIGMTVRALSPGPKPDPGTCVRIGSTSLLCEEKK